MSSWAISERALNHGNVERIVKKTKKESRTSWRTPLHAIVIAWWSTYVTVALRACWNRCWDECEVGASQVTQLERTPEYNYSWTQDWFWKEGSHGNASPSRSCTPAFRFARKLTTIWSAHVELSTLRRVSERGETPCKSWTCRKLAKTSSCLVAPAQRRVEAKSTSQRWNPVDDNSRQYCCKTVRLSEKRSCWKKYTPESRTKSSHCKRFSSVEACNGSLANKAEIFSR
jgi:hypothetical protein